MNYQVEIKYKDDKSITVHMSIADSERFFKCLESREVFWGNEEKQSGIWIPVEEIRYARIVVMADQAAPVVEELDSSSC